MNRFRRILTRWEKKPENFPALLHFVCAIITFRCSRLFGYALKRAIEKHGDCMYGDYEPPAEDFHVWLCDPNFEVIKEFAYPYSNFKMRGLAKWVTLETEPTELPRDFILCVGFNPHQTKGVYVYYDEQASGESFIGLPGGKPQPFRKGDWMIRAVEIRIRRRLVR